MTGQVEINLECSLDPLVKEAFQACRMNQKIHDRYVFLSDNEQLFETTSQGNKVQIHLSQKALDAFYNFKGV